MNFVLCKDQPMMKQGESTTTHYDYHVMDEQLVKLDILGHDDPTTIKAFTRIY